MQKERCTAGGNRATRTSHVYIAKQALKFSIIVGICARHFATRDGCSAVYGQRASHFLQQKCVMPSTGTVTKRVCVLIGELTKVEKIIFEILFFFDFPVF